MTCPKPSDVKFELNSKRYYGQAYLHSLKPHILRLEFQDDHDPLPKSLILKGQKNDGEKFTASDQIEFNREKLFYEEYACESTPTYYGATKVAGKAFLILSLIDGTPLNEVSASQIEGLDLEALVREPLSNLGAAGVILRDVYPRNFILENARVWAIDFGDWISIADATEEWKNEGECFCLDKWVRSGSLHIVEEVALNHQPRTAMTKFSWLAWRVGHARKHLEPGAHSSGELSPRRRVGARNTKSTTATSLATRRSRPRRSSHMDSSKEG
jgi:hypothetical protein